METKMETINPYVGPRSFKLELRDQKRFFGRNNETEDIISLILGHQLVLVYSESGVGKTSIFNAKVVPTLEKGFGFQTLPITRIGIVTSDEKELKRIDGLNFEDPSVKDKFNIFVLNALKDLKNVGNQDGPYALKSLSSHLKEYFPVQKSDDYENAPDTPQVLVIDQFEELFKFNPGIFEKYKNLFDFIKNNWYQQKKGFFNQVTEALKENRSLRIVLIIREDFLAQLDPFSRFVPEMLKPRYRLERLNKSSALAAIKGPLKSLYPSYYEKNGELDGEVNLIVEELLKTRVETRDKSNGDLIGEFVESIQLQVVCERWWRERHEPRIHQEKPLPNSLNHQDLMKLVNVDNALEGFYEESVAGASKETGIYEGDIRIWCEKNLLTSSETRSFVHRGNKITSGIPNKVVEYLEKKYLIRGDERSGAKWYELTHDRMIKPLLVSNRRWKDRLQLELIAKKRKTVRKLVISISLASLVLISALIYTFAFQTPSVLSDIAVNLDPANNVVYVANSDNDTMSVIAGATNTKFADIPVGGRPTDIAVNHKTNTIYVANSLSNTVSVIAGATNTKFADIYLDVHPLGLAVNPDTTHPLSLAVNPKNNLVYVSNPETDSVSVISGDTNKKLRDIPVGDNPLILAVNPANNLVYVANSDNDTVSVIDGTTNTKLGEIQNFKRPTLIDVNPDPDNNYVYVANSANRTVSVIDGNTNALAANRLAHIPTGIIPTVMELDPSNNVLYLTNDHDFKFVDIDNIDKLVSTDKLDTAKKNSVIWSAPTHIAVNPSDNLVYVANTDAETVSVIESTTNTKLGDIPVGSTPLGLAVNPKNHLVYVSNPETDSVSVIDGTTNTKVADVPAGKNPRFVKFNPSNNLVYVSNPETDSVSVMSGDNNTKLGDIDVGKRPTDIAVNPSNNLVYVVNSFSNTVSVINGTTNTKVADIDLKNAPRSVAVNPSNNLVYVVNSFSNTVSVINGTTNTKLRDIPVGAHPLGLAVNPSNNLVYVANQDTNTVSVINGTTNTKVADVPAGERPTYIAVNPANGLVYVSSPGDDTVTVIDNNGPSDKVVKLLNGIYVAVNPSNNLVYVANSDNDTVSVIDGATNTKVADIPVGVHPLGLAVNLNPANNLVYVANSDNDTVSVIDGTTNTKLGDIPVGGRPTDIAVNPDNNLVYVANSAGVVSVINGKNNTKVGIINAGNNLSSVAVNPSNNLVYVADSYDDIVSVVNGTTNTKVADLHIGFGPHSISVNPSNNLVYVVNSFSNTVSVINGTTNTKVADVPAGERPTYIAVNPANNLLYVANSFSNTVSVINGTTNTKVSDIPVGIIYNTYVCNSEEQFGKCG
jgi:YVTN family beta-propeller protein